MKILLSGYNGVMGEVVSLVSENIVAGYSNHLQSEPYPVYTDLDAIVESYDIILDFSHPSALKDLLNTAVKNKTPIVIGATGLLEGHHQMIDLASSHIPILQSGNFSLGMNALLDITQRLSDLLVDFDVEIIEKHHAQKVDAPSGSAEMLRDTVMSSRHDLNRTQYGRVGTQTRRDPQEIGMHSIRGGSIVGEHSVVFAGMDEVIEIKHSASSKKIFAQGALKACAFLLKQKPGRYTMKDVMLHD